jgi:hypothetical protein
VPYKTTKSQNIRPGLIRSVKEEGDWININNQTSTKSDKQKNTMYLKTEKKETLSEFIRTKREIMLVNMCIKDKEQEENKIDDMLRVMKESLE